MSPPNASHSLPSSFLPSSPLSSSSSSSSVISFRAALKERNSNTKRNQHAPETAQRQNVRILGFVLCSVLSGERERERERERESQYLSLSLSLSLFVMSVCPVFLGVTHTPHGTGKGAPFSQYVMWGVLRLLSTGEGEEERRRGGEEERRRGGEEERRRGGEEERGEEKRRWVRTHLYLPMGVTQSQAPRTHNTYTHTLYHTHYIHTQVRIRSVTELPSLLTPSSSSSSPSPSSPSSSSPSAAPASPPVRALLLWSHLLSAVRLHLSTHPLPFSHTDHITLLSTLHIKMTDFADMPGKTDMTGMTGMTGMVSADNSPLTANNSPFGDFEEMVQLMEKCVDTMTQVSLLLSLSLSSLRFLLSLLSFSSPLSLLSARHRHI